MCSGTLPKHIAEQMHVLLNRGNAAPHDDMKQTSGSDIGVSLVVFHPPPRHVLHAGFSPGGDHVLNAPESTIHQDDFPFDHLFLKWSAAPHDGGVSN